MVGTEVTEHHVTVVCQWEDISHTCMTGSSEYWGRTRNSGGGDAKVCSVSLECHCLQITCSVRASNFLRTPDCSDAVKLLKDYNLRFKHQKLVSYLVILSN